MHSIFFFSVDHNLTRVAAGELGSTGQYFNFYNKIPMPTTADQNTERK